MSTALAPLSALQVRAIHALAEHRRGALAAAALNLGQPSLSRHVRASEERLGAVLFQRGWSGSETTSAGDVVARQCQRILAALEALDASLQDEAGRPARLAVHARWRHLRAVTATARTGSVSAAAALMGVRQPAVSQALRDVSGFVGPPLFRRHRTGMEATPAALRLAAVWDEIAADLAQIPGLLGPSQTGLTGRVAVGMLPFSGQNLVVEAFAELTATHPHVRLVAIPGSYTMLAQALQRGEIDLIMGSLRDPAPLPGLIEEPLYDEHFTMIARHDHPCHDAPLTVAALARLQWSVAPHGTPVRRYFEAFFRDAPQPPQTQPCEIFSFANAEQMIVGSESVALLCYNDERLRALNPALRRLEIDLPDARVPVGVTRVAGAPLPPAVAAFLDRLRARIVALGL